MPLTPGTDTWATVAEADALLALRVGTQAWFALDEAPTAPGDESKDTYLGTAYQWLKGMYGLAATAAAPDALKEAQILAANWLIGNKIEYEKRETLTASGVEDFSWSQWSEKLGDVEVPRFISDLMINLGIGGGNGSVQLYGEDYQT